MGAFGRFEIVGDHLHHDGIALDASPSAHLIGIALLHAEGDIVPYDDLAVIIGSRSANPANVIKVHVHGLRNCVQGDVPILAHRRKGLSWPRAGQTEDNRHSERVTFSRTGMRVDGREISLAPLSKRISRYLWLRRDRSHTATDIMRAVGSDTRNPRNVLKVSMSAVKRAFAELGLTSPLRNVRGSGTRWTDVSSLAEHHVAQPDRDQARDQQPPR